MYFVADRYSDKSIHSDTWGFNVTGRSSYTMSLTDIRVYTSSDRPLYPGLLTGIPGDSAADTDLRILCR